MPKTARFVAPVVALVAVLSIGLALPAVARADTATTDAGWSSDEWRFAFTPYLWLPAQSGNVTARGRTAKVDVSIMDSLDLMGDHLSLIAGFFHFEAQRRRFFTFLDVQLAAVDTDDEVTIDVPDIGAVDLAGSFEQNSAIVELAGGYRLLELAIPERSRPFSLEAFVGVRYYYFWTQLTLDASNAVLGATSRRATGDLDWFDPMIGGRFAVPILDKLDLQVRGDIGGFDLGSDLAWSMSGFLRYFFDSRPLGMRPWLALGYKVLSFDWEDGSRGIDLEMSGPGLAIGATF